MQLQQALARLSAILLICGLGFAAAIAITVSGRMAAEAAAAGARGAAKPQRIVSLNLCTDQILFDLVPRERIAALSSLADDKSDSAIAAEVAGLRLTGGAAEDVLVLEPDLVIAGTYTTRATVGLLKRLGKRILVVPLANDLKGIAGVVRQIAKAVGEEARGEQLIARMEARLSQVQRDLARVPPQASRPRAVQYQVSSFAARPGGLTDWVLRAAGFANYAAMAKLARGGQLPLEVMLADPPDLIVLSHAPGSYRTVMADNLRHPAFRKLMARQRRVTVPQPLLICGTPRTLTAVEQLAKTRIEMAMAKGGMSNERRSGAAPEGKALRGAE